MAVRNKTSAQYEKRQPAFLLPMMRIKRKNETDCIYYIIGALQCPKNAR
jgi:hypothetical protein